MRGGIRLNDRLRILRVRDHMSQTEVAKKLHIHQSTLSKYELGTTDIPTSVLKQLAKLHDTSIDFILGLTDEIKPYPRCQKQD